MAYRAGPSAPAYLDSLLEEVSTLPTALKSRFTELRDMDDRAIAFMNDADKAVAETLKKAATKGPSTEALKKSFQEVIMLQGKAVDAANSKVDVAERAFDVVDDVIRTLDEKLKDFENQLRKDGRWPSSNAENPAPQGTPKEEEDTPAAGAQSIGSATRSAGNAANSIAGGSGNGGNGTTGSTHQKTRRSASSRAAAANASQKAQNKVRTVKSEPKNEPKISAADEAANDTGEQERYCVCNGPSYGDMIGCDNEDDCPYGAWFHFGCVGVTRAPSDGEKWYCRGCTSKGRKKG